MGVNLVNTADGEELINLMSDTVTEDTLLDGVTAHDASGEQITGKFSPYAPNLLDNGDFTINQFHHTGWRKDKYQEGDYVCDRWKYVEGDGEITFGETGGLTFSGTIAQILEHDISEEHLAYASAGKAAYDAATRTYTITSSGETIRWAMLVEGTVMLPFNKASAAVEMMKCQRHELYIPGTTRYTSGAVRADFIDFEVPIPTTMRTVPSLAFSSLKVKDHLTGVEVEGFTFAVLGRNIPNQVYIRATREAHGLTTAVLEIPVGSYLHFDASL